jgi:PTS system nitrogen regulatory IIA component
MGSGSVSVLDELVSVRWVARRCGVGLSTVYDWASRGVVPSYRLGGTLRFNPAEVEDWIAASSRRTVGERSA